MRTVSNHRVVLLTGFGPFPGVPHNASAPLVERLAKTAAAEFNGVAIHARVLPVEWATAPSTVARLVRTLEPDVAIHFGVSERARGFVIEQTAYNEAKEIEDDTGLEPRSRCLIAGSQPTRRASLPVKRIHARLTAMGLPTALSTDPGRYLCNAVLYHSLALSRRTDQRFSSGFIHVPVSLASQEPRKRQPAQTCPLTWDDALRGGMAIVQACLR